MALPQIDFFIASDTHHIRISDLSVWGTSEGKPTIIEIIFPGFDKCKTFYFDQHKTNVFNSTILGITCPNCEDANKEALSDGIYTFTVKASPDKYFMQRHYLKTDLFQMELDKLYIENKDSTNWRNFVDKVTEIEFLLAGAHAHLRMGLVKGAGMAWETAQALIEYVNNEYTKYI